MKPLVEIPEDEGPFERPWACVNHLFPFHMGRRPMRVPPRAGTDCRFSAAEAALWVLIAALADPHSDDALRAEALAAFGRGGLASSVAWQDRWWLGAAPFVAARLEAHGLLGELGSAERRPLLGAWMRGRDRAERIEARLGQVLDELAALGGQGLVLKGLAHAYAWYPEPDSRPAGDIDLLVRGVDCEQLRARLGAQGWRSIGSDRASAWAGHHHLRPMVLEEGGEPVLLELHTSLAKEVVGEAFGRWHEELWARAGEVPGRRRSLPALGPVDRVAHAVLHHTGELSFKGLLDLGLAAHAEGPETWAAARARLPRAERWRMTLAAGLARDLFAAPNPGAALPGRGLSAIDRAAVDGWGRAHAAWMRRAGGRVRPRHWLEPYAAQVDELCRSRWLRAPTATTAVAAARYALRQLRLCGRVASDLRAFVLPPRSAVEGSYVANAVRSAKSASSRFLRGLRGPHGPRNLDRDGVEV